MRLSLKWILYALLLATNLSASSNRRSGLPRVAAPLCLYELSGVTRTASPLSVELARPADSRTIERIAAENAYYSVGDPANGFLLGSRTLHDYEDAIERELLYVIRNETELIGFVILSELADIVASDDRAEVEKANLVEFFAAMPKLKWIGQVAIARDHLHQGYGRILYTRLFEMFPDYNFGSSVVLHATLDHGKFSNDASVGFHKKLGFEVVGTASYPYKDFRDLTVGIHLRRAR